MKSLVTRMLCALALAGVGTTASAVPIYFDFTGSITDATGTYAGAGLEGTEISGGFLFETTDLARFLNPIAALEQFNGASSEAYLSYRAGSISFPLGFAGIIFVDTDCYSFDNCIPVSPFREGFELSAISRDVDPGNWVGYVGQVKETFLGVVSMQEGDAGDFDWTTATPTDIVARALHEMGGSYGEALYTCTGGFSCEYETLGRFDFNIDTVTRGIGPRAVPEPGTFGLFALALSSIWLMRRRVPAEMSRSVQLGCQSTNKRDQA